ncbi:MAG: hypothetical protein H5U05_08955 [Candidatus Aminicenantes bacterium]|nr:hypothetical protein [Candidatus Aminicenantes bacterium]
MKSRCQDKGQSRILPIFLWTVFLFMASVISSFAQQRMLFKNISPDDPRRTVIQTVLNSPFHSMRFAFSSKEWTSGHYGGAWERARQYFPNHVYYTTSERYFMTHFFNPNGKLEMEIYNSAYLRMSVANYGTFTSRGIVASYRAMRANDPAAAQEFASKMGWLEPYFHDEASKNRLKHMIGGKLFDRLLKELRQENYHMFAASLMHEGMHSKMDDGQLARAIQEEYQSCQLPVQWDELRAYMCEINYHNKFYNWAIGNISSSWKQIENLLQQLEAWRKRPKPLTQAEKDKIEAIKAKIKAYIALIRLRMREIWQSVQRIQNLVMNFQKEYLKPNAPPEHRQMLDRLLVSVTDFANKVGDEIMRQELRLRDLEQQLDLWNKWASCENPSPPPKEVAEEIIKQVKGTRWPAPPVDQTEDIRKKAEREIGKLPGSLGAPAGERIGREGRGRTRQNFIFSVLYHGASPSMKDLNGYLDYINQTWEAELKPFGWENGFAVSLGWQWSEVLEVGLTFDRSSTHHSGPLNAVGSVYTSSHSLASYGLYLSARSNEILTATRLVARSALLYCRAHYQEEENGFITAGNDGAIGFSIAAGPEFEVSSSISFFFLGGYRQANFDGFEMSFFIPGSPPVNLEFSGFLLQAGLSVRF